MSDMKHLKVVDDKWKGYTGALGIAEFKDGISVYPLPRHIRDRMAAAMNFVEVDTDGNEQPAGAAHRMIREYAERAAPITELARQTDGEKNAEIAASQVELAKTPVVLSRFELEAVASKGGIKGLREIGNKWNVKHRAIPTLIEMILDAQDKAVAKTKKPEAPVEPVVDPADPAEDDVMAQIAAEKAARDAEILAAEQRQAAEAAEFLAAEKGKEEALKDAAASGDLAAAVSTDETPQE
ncbi:hypothetical protein SAMN05216358_0019 [Rhizobium sp. AN5]|uniref:hypothetical protein n=1 Tax=Rhizobium sp. AN5 TaxID=1855304 RepID=UPI000BC3B9BE|nr:hypothetical protein [Rhizobium sp. AN5]SOC90003.1 hypothetical protein SAMN05216358_0019 [Rhizobium sp. AN5]